MDARGRPALVAGAGAAAVPGGARPLVGHVERAYEIAGRDAEHAFWGEGEDPTRSMLHRIALRTV